MDKPIYQPPIIPPVRPVGPPARTGQAQKPADKAEFGSLLKKEIAKVSFSGHAEQRLASRNIRMTEDQLGRLEEAVTKAEAKGARTSLVLMDNLALVVSVTNRKVVTAIDGPNVKENVFTNIDSAVVI